MAMNLPKESFEVDYYYCDAAPYIGSDDRHGDTDPARLKQMKDSGVCLIQFHVGAYDLTKPTHDWVDTDFWKVFDPGKYDLIQTAKAGHSQYPYYLIDLPVVELVAMAWAGVDHSPNIAWTIHPSSWQWGQWLQRGGRLDRVSVIPGPALRPNTTEDLRRELGIPPQHVTAGLLQRADNHIFSPIPLKAFSRVCRPDRHFIIMNGGSLYQRQAKALGLQNIHFIPHSGQEKAASKFFNTLDFFAHGRKDGETYGTVLAEAMMHGKPCLSHYAKWGANAQPETMGPAGLWASDLEDYTIKLDQLYSDPNLRTQLASKARQHAEDHFSIEGGVKKLIRAYKMVLGMPISEDPLFSTDYALSPLGFLHAGDAQAGEPWTLHVVSGEIPEALEMELVCSVLPFIQTFVTLEGSSGLYGFTAAHRGAGRIRVFMFEPKEDARRTLEKTVWLNNWEDRVTIVSASANALNDRLGTLEIPRVDFIKIDWQESFLDVLAAADKAIRRDRPVLLITRDNETSIDRFSDNWPIIRTWLTERGYRIWESTPGGRLRDITLESHSPAKHFFAFHSEAHRSWISHLKRRALRYRLQRSWSRMKRAIWACARYARHPKRIIKGLFRRARQFTSNILYVPYLVAAYVSPDGRIHARIQKYAREYHGWNTGVVTPMRLERAERFRQRLMEAQLALHSLKVTFDLGAQRVGFQNLCVYCRSRSLLESTLYLEGIYDELPILQAYQDILKPGDGAVDVGANIGVHSLALARIVTDKGRVFAFEPIARLAAQLRRNMELNHVKNIEVRETALSDRNGEIPFKEDADNFNQGVGRYETSSKDHISADRLDEALADRREKIRLIKIDVEGMELQVVRGASNLLAQDRPCLVVEHNSPPWNLHQLTAAIPYKVDIIRFPNNGRETPRPVSPREYLRGFNNILIRPKGNDQ
jgi:FkbM family methyltransferase